MGMVDAANYFLLAGTFLNYTHKGDVALSVFFERGFFWNCDTISYFDYPIYLDQQHLNGVVSLLSKNVSQYEDMRTFDAGRKLVSRVTGDISNSADVSGFRSELYFIKIGNERKFQFLKSILF
jgi:hypothetical protein